MPDLHRAREAVLNRNILFTPRNELIIEFYLTEPIDKIKYSTYRVYLARVNTVRSCLNWRQTWNCAGQAEFTICQPVYELWCRASYVQTVRLVALCGALRWNTGFWRPYCHPLQGKASYVQTVRLVALCGALGWNTGFWRPYCHPLQGRSKCVEFDVELI